jgi:hypothetical protein
LVSNAVWIGLLARATQNSLHTSLKFFGWLIVY